MRGRGSYASYRKSKLGAQEVGAGAVLPRGNLGAANGPVVHHSTPLCGDFLKNRFDCSHINTSITVHIDIEGVSDVIDNTEVVVGDGEWFLRGVSNKSSCLILSVERVVVGEATAHRHGQTASS